MIESVSVPRFGSALSHTTTSSMRSPIVHSTGEPTIALDREEVASAGVAGWVAQLAHCARLDLANSLACEVECLADFFKRAWLAAIETETQCKNFAFALVEWCKQSRDFLWQ